jgi:hypothetical protein
MQALLDEFRRMPWMGPDYKESTFDALREVERYWRRYSAPALRLQSEVRLGQVVFADWGSYCTHMDVDHRTALLSEESSTYMNSID